MLNNREEEILKLIAKGNSQKAVADSIKLSIASIKFYIGTAKKKLKAKNLCHAVVLFLKIK